MNSSQVAEDERSLERSSSSCTTGAERSSSSRERSSSKDSVMFIFGEDANEFIFIHSENGQYKVQEKYGTSANFATINYYKTLNDALEASEPLGFKLIHSLKHHIPYELVNII